MGGAAVPVCVLPSLVFAETEIAQAEIERNNAGNTFVLRENTSCHFMERVHHCSVPVRWLSPPLQGMARLPHLTKESFVL